MLCRQNRKLNWGWEGRCDMFVRLPIQRQCQANSHQSGRKWFNLFTVWASGWRPWEQYLKQGMNGQEGKQSSARSQLACSSERHHWKRDMCKETKAWRNLWMSPSIFTHPFGKESFPCPQLCQLGRRRGRPYNSVLPILLSPSLPL